MDETYIAERLAQLRTRMGVSARDMSLSMGQSENFINNIENRKSMPSIQSFFYICEHLKITPKEFFDEDAADPTLLNELITELKPLSVNALECLIGFVRELKGKK